MEGCERMLEVREGVLMEEGLEGGEQGENSVGRQVVIVFVEMRNMLYIAALGEER